jgi:hypothetical protein
MFLQRQILFGPCMLFYLLNLMVILQATKLSELQSHWFLSLHGFFRSSYILTWLVVSQLC